MMSDCLVTRGRGYREEAMGRGLGRWWGYAYCLVIMTSQV